MKHPNILLLLAAIIWGFAFVAQRIGMEYVGPFTFNGFRFLLGTVVLLPFLLKKERRELDRRLWLPLLATGLLLFGGASFQQVGIQHTTAGKAGFITGLYVVFIPVAGIFLKHKAGIFVWIGVVLSAAGLYLLSITGRFTMESGDLLVLCCAVIFTAHVLLIGWLSPRMDSYLLAVVQFLVCGFLSLVVAIPFEQPRTGAVLNASIPVLYGGIFSVGIAFTLQVVAQKHAKPVTAAIILSLEAVFAAFGGWLILDEKLTVRMIVGSLLMLAGMMFVQLKGKTTVMER